MDPELLPQLLDYAWLLLLGVVGWGVKLSMRTSALEREVIALHKHRDEDERRRSEQRREMIDTINNNHLRMEKKVDRLLDKLIKE